MKQDVKYIATLAALVIMAGSLPAVQEVIHAAALNNDPVAQTGSAILSFMNFGSSSPSQHMGVDGVRPPKMMEVKDYRIASTSGLRLEIQKPQPIPPMEVVAILYKNGFISEDKIDGARKLVATLQQKKGNDGEGMHASTTPQRPPFMPFSPQGMHGTTEGQAPMHR